MTDTENLSPMVAAKVPTKTIRAIAIAIAIMAFSSVRAEAQEALLSTAENYYELESLFGNAERSYLNYRTLSDSRWALIDSSRAIWGDVTLGSPRELTKSITFRVYGPELFSSYNSAEPYGQNDGALWQGKGFNSSLTAGARVEGYGFELTFKPQVSFSQNRAFDLVTPAYSGSDYAGKGDTYGYFGVPCIDAPQRFGDDSFWAFSWGDSEIRYSWKTLTVGFGTQAIWLGPAKVNPIIHSNNAPPYPKLDVGLRKQEVVAFGRELGDVEARLWCGYLTESDYFDNDGSNDHTMISGLAFAYAPSFLDGLTLFMNRTYHAQWEKDSLAAIPRLFFFSPKGTGDEDVWDQRASFGFDYRLTEAAFEVYGEIGLNDYTMGKQAYLRYPFHSMVYTAGLRKGVRLPTDRPFALEILFELSSFEMSQDFQFFWPSTFYAHHQLTQGYTNGGQWLGSGNGTGGNSQYLGFKLYYPKGYTTLFVHRQNPDNDNIWKKSLYVAPDADSKANILNIKVVLALGVESGYCLLNQSMVSAGIAWIHIENPRYGDGQEIMNGFRCTARYSWYY